MVSLSIKNMVCDRCIYMVRQLFESAGLQPLDVQLGTVALNEEPNTGQYKEVQETLRSLGFEILSDQKKQLVEKMKNKILSVLRSNESDALPVFSIVLATALHKDYSYLSKLFSEAEGITIEKYIINQKIEKVKELLVYGELTISEIAYQLGYSSVAYLSARFKKTTGFTPSAFRSQKDHRRRPLDKI